MIPPNVNTAHNANSAVEKLVTLVPLTVGIKTLASIITPRVTEIIPLTNPDAILNNTPLNYSKTVFIYIYF